MERNILPSAISRGRTRIFRSARSETVCRAKRRQKKLCRREISLFISCYDFCIHENTLFLIIESDEKSLCTRWKSTNDLRTDPERLMMLSSEQVHDFQAGAVLAIARESAISERAATGVVIEDGYM